MDTSTPLKKTCSKQPGLPMPGCSSSNDIHLIYTKHDVKQVFSKELSDCGHSSSNPKSIDLNCSVEVFPMSPISCMKNVPASPLPYLDSSNLKWSTSLHTSYADEEAVEMIDQTCTPYQDTADLNCTNFDNETSDKIIDESFSAMNNTSYVPCSPVVAAARVKRRKKNKELSDENCSQETLGARKNLSSVLAANENDEARLRILCLNERALEFDDSFSKSFNMCTPSENATPKTNLYPLTSRQENKKFIYPFSSDSIKKPPSFLPVDQLTNSALTLEVHNLRCDLHLRNCNDESKTKTTLNEFVGCSMAVFNELYNEDTIKKTGCSQASVTKFEGSTAPINCKNVIKTRAKLLKVFVEIIFGGRNNDCDTIRVRFDKIADQFVNGEDNCYGARTMCHLYSAYFFLTNVSLRSFKKEYIYKHETIQNVMQHISNSFKLAVSFDYVKNLFDRFENDIFTLERMGIPVTALYISYSRSTRYLLTNSDKKGYSALVQQQLLEHLTPSKFERKFTGDKFDISSSGFCTASGNRLSIRKKSINHFLDKYSDIIHDQRNDEVLLADKERRPNKRDVAFVTLSNISTKPSLARDQHMFQTGTGKTIDIQAKPSQSSDHLFSDILDDLEIEFNNEWKNVDEKWNENMTSGFKTGSGKTINIEDKSLQKSKNLFSDMTNETDCNIDNGHKKSDGIAASGFKTCSGRTINVNNKSLQKSRNLFSEISDQLESNINSEYNSAFEKSNEIAASGFKTCSGRTIVVDNKSLQKSRNLLSDQTEFSIENNSKIAFKNPIENTTPSFKTCSGKTNKVDNKLLRKSRNLFSDILNQAECSIKNNSSSVYKNPIENATSGFKTCSGKTINVDNKILQKSRNLFSDITDQPEFSIENNSNRAYREPTENTTTGFKTCSGRTINVDSQLMQKSTNLFSDISNQMECSAYEKPIENTTLGFKTCSGKTINFDNKLLQKSRNLFSDITDQTVCSIKKNSNSAFRNPIESSTVGFKTCSGKMIKVDEKLLQKSKNLFSDISEQAECNLVNDLENTCKKSDEIATSIFKTCSGKTINVDSKSSEVSKNLFSDLLNEEKTIDDPAVFANGVSTFNAGAKKTSTPIASTRSKKKKENIVADVKHDSFSNSIQNQSFDLVKEITESTSAFLYDISSEQSGSSFFIPNDSTANVNVKSVTENHKNADISDAKIKSRPTSPVFDAKYAPSKRKNSTRRSGGAQSLNITFVRKNNTSDSDREQRDKSTDNACAELDTFKMNFSFKSVKRKSSSLENLPVTSKKSKNDSRARQSSWPQSRIGLAIQQERYVSSKPKEFCRPTRGYYSTSIGDATGNNTKASSEDGVDVVIGSKVRISLRQLARSEPPKQYSYEEYLKLGLLPAVIRTNSQNARRFTFTHQFFSDEQLANGANSAVSFGDTVPLILNEKNEITFEEIATGFLASPGVDPKLISREWIANHYRWIIWKLASLERFFPKSLGRRYLTLDNLLFQLKFKYEQEVDRCNRSALKRILEGDDSPARPIVLCVAFIDKGTNSSNGYKIELTDGWYSIFAQVDEEMNNLIMRKKLLTGTKLFVTGAELVGLREPCDPLQIDENVFFKFSTNSCRRVRWDTQLGFYRSSRTPVNKIQTILPKGGLISQLKAVVARVYPLLFLEKYDNATEVVDEPLAASWSRLHNEKLEIKKMMAYERERQNVVESLLSQVTNEVLKENGKTCTDDFTNSASGQDHERLRDVIQQRVQSRLPIKFSKNRHVSRLLKLRLVDTQDVKNKTSAILTIWNPCEEVTTFFKEDRSYHFFNVNANYFRNGELQLSSTRSSKYDGGCISNVENSWFRRCVRSVDDLNTRDEEDGKSCIFDEVDVTGIIIKIKSQSCNYEQSDRIYVADLQQRFFALSFRVDPKNFDFGDSIESGKIVAGLNLQWKKGWLCWKIPILYVSELSSFIQSTNITSLQSTIDRIREHFRRNNLETFITECEAKLNGIVGSVTEASTSTSENCCKHFSSSSTTTKTSPVVQTDSCNQNKSNFPSTFKNAKVACKYEKLQNYGRAPALSPIVLTSQSKTKAKLPVLRRSFKS